MPTTWKDIPPIPTSQEFLDIVLSRTQRRLPTQIRSGFKITRIRAFYIRKVKYTSETFCEKFQVILDGFPRLGEIHPFYQDLLHTLYDADHFRIALGQVSTAKHLIETIARDYVRLLKYGQSLFQCKQLKRSGLGRMATICKRLKDCLMYLEQVRQHLGRLPSIDPDTRTLLICGYPNVGKSSFLKTVSRAEVDIQPYAFTTKSLFVGHFDYKMLRFQAIDTPGILDHPLDEMNTIEMQSITAIAHLRSAILYFMDLSEQCGYPVSAQIQLFKSIRPLFANKLVFIVINKIDITKFEDLDSDTQALLRSLLRLGEVEMLQLSCTTSEGVMSVRNQICDKLLAERNAQKLRSSTNSAGEANSRLSDLLRRIHVAQPLDGITNPTFIPRAVNIRSAQHIDEPRKRQLERDLEQQSGGPGVYSVDLKKHYLDIDFSHIHDSVPEFLNGRNVADYIDLDVVEKLSQLEAEEEMLEAAGHLNEKDNLESNEDQETRHKASMIRERRQLIKNEAQLRKSLKNRALIPRKVTARKLSDMESHLNSLGYDATDVCLRARSKSQARHHVDRSSTNVSDEGEDAMKIDQSTIIRKEAISRSSSRARVQSINRRNDGVINEASRAKAEKLAKLSQKKMNRAARQGEADRHTSASIARHLASGKRGIGKTQRR